jgi:ketosteroid isomerase-like protein
MKPEAFLRDYEAALAAQGWESVAPLIHEDACVTFSDGSFYQGKREIQRAFKRNFALIQDEVYQISQVHWVRKAAEFAVCVYEFQWEGIIGGKQAGGLGRGTMVIVKDGSAWLLAAEHLSPKR